MSSAESLRELIIERLTAAAEEIFRVVERTVVQYEEEIDRQRRLLDITWKPEIKLHRTAESLRELIIERLTAAAEEIFRLFERTVVQYEEEIDRQRRLLDITWKPEIKLHRIDLQQHYTCKEEVLDDQQLCNQERNSSLDQEEPEPPQIKEEPEEPDPLQIKEEQEEKMLLNQETDSPTEEETELSEPEPNSDQLLSNISPVAESSDQEGSKHVDSRSTRNVELNPKKRRHRDTRHSNNVDISPMSESQSDTDTGNMSLTCDVCRKTFKSNFNMKVHRRSHTGEKPYCCKTCGKSFRRTDNLSVHMTIHTGEHLHYCHICEKGFRWRSHLSAHMRTHTGEKPYLCKLCGKSYSDLSSIRKHAKIHSGERPYCCKTCGRSFSQGSHLTAHMMIHTGERPYLCKVCGKGFGRNTHLTSHMRTHTRKKMSH